MEVIPGRIDRNINKMLEMIAISKNEGVDLVVFPELCVSGYILSDMWVNESFCDALMNCNDVMLKASEGIAIVYGNIYLDRAINARLKDSAHHPNKDGRTRKYNAVYAVQNGRPARRVKESNILPEGVQPKTLLPEYRIFDDERYFFSMQDVAKDAGVLLRDLIQPFILEIHGNKTVIGCEVCEDLWCNDYRLSGKPLNVTDVLIDNGAEIIVNISASPWNYGKNTSRDNRIAFLKELSGDKFVPFLYVNKIGVENNGKNFITFDGGTTVYNRDGKPVVMAKESYREELIILEDPILNGVPVTRSNEPKIRRKFEAIVSGIKHMALFKGENERLEFVIGLSGGIDSAVVACLLTFTCGKDNVIAVNMPSAYNLSKTKETARYIADKLGIQFHTIPIDSFIPAHDIFKDFDRKFAPSKEAKELSNENVQSKIRGTCILSNLAGRYNRFFTCNGNKLEIALGYTTLYGDVNGAIAPIGDLTKTEVYEMARFLNDEIFKDEIIPHSLFPDPVFSFNEQWVVPSPELKANQVDPMRFGYHDALLEALTDYIRKSPEDILQWYLDGALEKHLGIEKRLIVRWGIDDPRIFVQDLEWFITTVQKNIFKRVQAPPIIITSRSSYGYDIRESMIPFYISPQFEGLKSKVLKLERYKTSIASVS